MSPTPPLADKPVNDEPESRPFDALVPLAPLQPLVQASPQPWSVKLWGWGTQLATVTVLSALAAFTWWIAKKSDTAPVQHSQKLNDSAPDFVLNGFALKEFNAQGQLQSIVRGKVLMHFPLAKTVTMQAVQVNWDDVNGIAHQAMADQAVGDDATTRIELSGRVNVQRLDQQSPAQFLSERLVIFPQTKQLQSNQPVELRQGNAQLIAQSFEYDHQTAMVTFKGGVKGEIQ